MSIKINSLSDINKGKAQQYIKNARKMLNLIGYLQPYLHKKGLKDAKEDLKLLMDYVTDVAKGKYTQYNTNRLLIILGTLLYVVNPVDMIPDFIIGGFLDDITVIGWAITKVSQELQEYRIYKYGIKEVNDSY